MEPELEAPPGTVSMGGHPTHRASHTRRCSLGHGGSEGRQREADRGSASRGLSEEQEETPELGSGSTTRTRVRTRSRADTTQPGQLRAETSNPSQVLPVGQYEGLWNGAHTEKDPQSRMTGYQSRKETLGHGQKAPVTRLDAEIPGTGATWSR